MLTDAAAAVHRGWINIKSAITGQDDAAILGERRNRRRRGPQGLRNRSRSPATCPPRQVGNSSSSTAKPF
ncbi:MAG: hypothetical protein WKG07_48590 [Hymenobacter sp.]